MEANINIPISPSKTDMDSGKIFLKFLFTATVSFLTIFLLDNLLGGLIGTLTLVSVLWSVRFLIIFAILVFSVSSIFYKKNLSTQNNGQLLLLILCNFLSVSIGFLIFIFYQTLNYGGSITTFAISLFSWFIIFIYGYDYYFLLLTIVFASITLTCLNLYLKKKGQTEYTNFHFVVIFLSLLVIPLSFDIFVSSTSKLQERSQQKLSESATVIKLPQKDIVAKNYPGYPSGYLLGNSTANSPSGNLNLKVKRGNQEPNKIIFTLTNLATNQNKDIYFNTKFRRTTDSSNPETFEWIDDNNILIYQHQLIDKNFNRNGLAIWKFNVENFQNDLIVYSSKYCVEDNYRFFSNLNQLRYVAENGDVVSVDLKNDSKKILYHLSNFDSCRLGEVIWSNNGNKLAFEYPVGNSAEYTDDLDIINLETQSVKKLFSKAPIGIICQSCAPEFWSPNDTKINTFHDYIYDVEKDSKIDLVPIYKTLIHVGGMNHWYDDNSLIADTSIGKVLINLTDLSYKKVEVLAQ